MIVTAALWAGGALTLSGAILWAAFHVVRSFGDFAASNRAQAEAIRLDTAAREKNTTLMLAMHESLQMVAGDNAKLWAAIQKARRNGHNEEVA